MKKALVIALFILAMVILSLLIARCPIPFSGPNASFDLFRKSLPGGCKVMVDHIRNEAAIVERVGELAKSCGIEVKQVSYRPMSVPLDRKDDPRFQDLLRRMNLEP